MDENWATYDARRKARGKNLNPDLRSKKDDGKKLNLFHHGHNEDLESIESLERDLPDESIGNRGKFWGSMHNPYGKD